MQTSAFGVIFSYIDVCCKSSRSESYVIQTYLFHFDYTESSTELIDACSKARMLTFLCSIVVEETGEPGENYRPWIDDHCLSTCRRRESNSGRSGDKRETYACAISTVTLLFLLYHVRIDSPFTQIYLSRCNSKRTTASLS